MADFRIPDLGAAAPVAGTDLLEIYQGADPSLKVTLSAVLTYIQANVSPGGTPGQVQFNNAGAFGGFTFSGDLTVDTATGVGTIAALAITTGKIAAAAVTEVKLGISNNTTGNVSTGAHGFAPILPNDATKFLNGVGGYTVPPGTAAGTVTTTGSPANGNLTKFSGASSVTSGDLSGDVTTAGSLATTIAANAVTTVKINNGAVNKNKLAAEVISDNNNQWYGDGADGNVTINSGTTVLTRNMYYNNLTLAGGVLNLNGFIPFCLTFDISNAVAGNVVNAFNGGNLSDGVTTASSSAGGGGGVVAAGNILPGGQGAGTSGTVGATGAGTQPSAAPAASNSIGLAILSGAGGKGGNGTPNAGGASRAGVTPSTPQDKRYLDHLQMYLLNDNGSSSGVLTGIRGGASAPGGAGGGGDGTHAGGGGGGGGGATGPILIFAQNIIRGGSTAAGCINARGANGGGGGPGNTTAGANTGGGGGGGGSGANWLVIVYATLSGSVATNALAADGGIGGAGGAGFGTGVGGDSGQAGGQGRIDIYNTLTGTLSLNQGNPAVVASNPGVGLVGGAAVPNQFRVSL